MITDLFYGRKLAIATMHKKEQAILPALQGLGVLPLVPGSFDTDRFGTFSGEIERTLSPLEAARAKCIAACNAYNCTLGIASEGSFGPHPALFFVPADDEVLLFVDIANNIEIKARLISCDTNFAGEMFYNMETIIAFAQKAMFPSHALIVRAEKHDTSNIIKGIRQWNELEDHCNKYLKKYGKVFVETDMRAMYNPSRMKVITTLSHTLVQKMRSLCPICHWPGYDVTDIKSGLPCNWCGSPTASTLSHVYVCQKCEYKEERLYPNDKTTEDPTYCDKCNP